MKDHLKQKRVQEQLFHGRHTLTMANLIPAMQESFPELEEIFLEYKDDSLQTGAYDQGFFTYVFNPFLKDFLQAPQKYPNLLGKRLFHYLEQMARSPEGPVVNVLAVVILEHLSAYQLEVARLYIGPKTKQVLQDIQQYWKDLNAA